MLLDPTALALVAALGCIAAIIGGMGGFGTGIILTAALAPFIGVKNVIPVLAVAGAIINGGRFCFYRKSLQRRGQAHLRGKRDRRKPRRDEIVGERVADVARGPAGEHVGDDRSGIARLAQRRAVRVLHVRLLAAQERRSHLHGARAEHEGRRHLPPVGDAAGGDHRHAHRIDHLR